MLHWWISGGKWRQLNKPALAFKVALEENGEGAWRLRSGVGFMEPRWISSVDSWASSSRQAEPRRPVHVCWRPDSSLDAMIGRIDG